MSKCYHCQNDLSTFLISKVSRQDSCPKCHRDIRCCYNCAFFEANAHWECKEEVVEHVLDKEKSNFCDFFKLGGSTIMSGTKSKEDLLSAADALFKKK